MARQLRWERTGKVSDTFQKPSIAWQMLAVRNVAYWSNVVHIQKKYDLAFSKLSAPACVQLHARSFTRQFEQDLPQSGFTCTSHCRHPNEGIQVGHARLRLLLRITVEATSVEALCTLARGYPFRREKHKTCELSQHRQRSIWQPLVKNGAEK